MFFSIIVPVYNAEKYLDRCIKSILNQSFEEFELIIVNDGSNDQSLSIIKKYAHNDRRIKYKSQTNKGLSFARNTGIKLSSGNYIVFVDADDWIDPNYLYISKNYIEEYKPDIISYQHCGSKEELTKKSVYKVLVEKKQCANRLFDLSVSNYAWAKVIKRDTILSCGSEVFPEGRRYEDIATMYKLFCKANVLVCSEEVLYFYEQNNSQSITFCRVEQDIKDDISTLNEMLNFKEGEEYEYWNYYLLVKIFGFMSDLYKIEKIDQNKIKQYVRLLYKKVSYIKFRKIYLEFSANGMRAVLIKLKLAHIYFKIKRVVFRIRNSK